MPILRTLFVAAAMASACPALAYANEDLSGQWQADVGHGVVINMDILADGHWYSTTIQDNKVAAELAGTYHQTPKDDANGRIVFTPLHSKVSGEHGAAKVEDDTYQLINGSKELTLTTGSEVMQFTNTTKE